MIISPKENFVGLPRKSQATTEISLEPYPANKIYLVNILSGMTWGPLLLPRGAPEGNGVCGNLCEFSCWGFGKFDFIKILCHCCPV